MVHVLHIIQALTLGGAARSMIAVAKYSSRYGEYRHSVIALQTADPEATALAEEAGVRVLVTPDAPTLERELREADIVQVQYWNNPEVAAFLRRLFPPMRLVLWYHIAGNGSPQIITPELAALPDLNVPCNPFSYHDLPVFRDMPEETKEQRVVLAYDAADFDRVRTVRPRPHDGFNVGYIGTVDFVKMHRNFVPMSAAVNVPDVRFIVCGGGIEDQLRRQAAILRAADRFDFRGYVKDIAPVLSVLDVYGYPLCEDTYAAAELNLQEVMYAGIPPVVFPYGGVGRLVEHNVTGVVVHSEREYTEAVEYLYHSPDERRRLGDNAADYARKVFGAENAARVMNAAYDRLMAQDKRLHAWGRDAYRPLLEQPLLYSDIAGEPERISAAHLFVDSLGDAGGDFRASLSAADERTTLRAERRIAGASHLVLHSGLEPYRQAAPNDALLHLWTGLAYEGRGQDNEALAAYLAALQLGLKEWRVYWYLARTLEHSGRTEQAAQLFAQLRASVPQFDDIIRDVDDSSPEELFAEVMSMGAEEPQREERVLSPAEELFAEVMKEGGRTASAPSSEIVVSAIVSVYNAERFIEGCLQDLVEQTLFAKGGLEIVVVDSGSQQNEGAVVQQFQKRYPNIRYIRTERETIYAAWNRGVQAASGRYITNANADDRHRSDMLERLAAELDRRPDVALVYADSAATPVENARFGTAEIGGYLRWPQFDRRLLFQVCYVGPHPMWRRALHDRYGLFDEEMRSAGDYEFWLRIVATEQFLHIPEVMGLYLLSSGGMEFSDQGLSHRESDIARARHWPAAWGQPPTPQGSYYIPLHPPMHGGAPLVSVIVPTYNRPDSLHEALVSLERQTFRNFEVVVVNDAGDDISALLDGFRLSLSIRSLRHDRNRERCAARNTGLKAAQGRYIAYLDDDDVYYPQHLETLVRTLMSTSYRVAYTDAVRLQYRTEPHGRVEVGRDIPYSFDFSRDRLLYENYIPMLCVMHEAACIEATGMFDEELSQPLEDWDLWIRLAQTFEFAHIARPTCEFREDVHPQRLASLNRAAFYTNAQRIFDKYRSLTENRPDIRRLQQGYLAGLKQIEEQYKRQAPPPVQVSIIIPTLNNIDYTRQCIDGIRETVGAVSYEIIVVDNGSTDGTRDYLKAETEAGRLRAIFNERNETFSHANNQGAAIAHGKYLLFLNNDTKPLPGWLDAMTAAFERDPSIGIQGGKLLYPNATIQHAGIVYGRVRTGMLMHYHIYLCLPHDAPCVNREREFQMVTGAMLAVRRELYERVGGFDEAYVFGHEDLDLCLAVRKLGFRVWYNPRFAAYHFESMTKKSEGIEKFELRLQDPDSIDAKNYYYFHDKWKGALVVDADRYYIEDGFEPPIRSGDAVQTTGQPRASTPAAGSKPRVLFTMYGWRESGGGTTFPRAIARRLAAEGYEVSVVYAAGAHPTVSTPYHLDETTEDGVRLFGVHNRPTVFLDADNPAREIRDENVVRLFAQVLDTVQPDVVHFHNFLGLSFAIADETKRRGIPTVYTPHNYHLIDPMLYMFRSDLALWSTTDMMSESEVVQRHPELEQEFRRRMDAARRLLTDTIDYTLAVSTRQRDILADFCGDNSRIAVVHQAHETVDTIAAAELRPHEPHRPVRFGFIGGVMPHKGLHVLVQAAQQRDVEAEVHIHGFVGERYREQLDSMDGRGILRWHGAYSERDLPAIARELDAAVVPSVWEDCAPLVALEALAMGLPVFGARMGGIPDYVRDGVNGRLYAHDRPDELAALLRWYAGRPDELKRLAQRCTATFRCGDYVRHMLSVYGGLARREHLSRETISLLYSPEPLMSTSEEPMDTAMNRLQFSQSLPGGFSNRRASGTLPQPLPNPLYLNLGCGRDVRDDCVNIDLYSDDPRVVGMDVRRLDLPDNCADGIIASDILEHFSHREVDAVLKEWARVLKPGGELVVRCPSLHLQMKAYMNGVWDADIASYMIFGGQTNPGDYHCIGFDERSIKHHLAKVGLDVFFFEEVDTPQDRGFINLNMTVRARKQGQPHTPRQEQHSFAQQQNASQPSRPQASSVASSAVAGAPGADKRTSVQQDGKPRLNIVWEGSQFVTHSLALINREHCSNLIRSGMAELTIVPYELDEFSPHGNEKFEELQAHDIRYKKDSTPETKRLPYVWIRHQWPPKLDAPQGARWIVMQPWEFSALRRDFVEAFKKADEVWTPSTYARNAFVNSGLDFNKVQVVPNGINPALFTPFGARAELSTRKSFRFLFVGGTIFRKGIDVLLQAYAQEFTAEDDVCLVIKDMGGKSFYRGQTAQQTIEEFRRRPNAPEVEYIDRTMSEEDMAGLFRACQVFVSPYRGEGFSLPTLEAMACGLPVIVTEGGATDDFVDEEVGWLVPAGQRSLGSVIDGHQLTGEAFVLEPSVEACSEQMRVAYDHPAEAARRGRTASLRARTQWTWNRATLKLLSRLDVLYNTDMTVRAQDSLCDRDDGNIDVCRAEQAYFEGRIDDAIALYNSAVERRGLPEEYVLLTLHRLASIALVDGETELAEEFLAKARTLDPDHPDTRYVQSLVHAWREEWEKELDILEPLLDEWKTARFSSRLGTELDTLLCDMGRALYSLDLVDDAKEVYSLALGVNNENPDACYGAALCFARLGAMDEARTMLEWAVRLRPDFEAAREALEEIDA